MLVTIVTFYLPRNKAFCQGEGEGKVFSGVYAFALSFKAKKKNHMLAFETNWETAVV